MNQQQRRQFEELRRQGDLSGVEALLDAKISGREGVPEKWLALYILTVFAVEEGYLDQAISYCLKMIEIDALDPSIYHLIGLIYRLQGKLSYAEHELRRSLALSTDSLIAKNHFAAVTELGKVLLEINRIEECEVLCTSDWDPDDPALLAVDSKGEDMQNGDRLLLLARLSRKQRRYGEAIMFYRKVIRIRRNMRQLTIDSEALLEELAAVIRESEQGKSQYL